MAYGLKYELFFSDLIKRQLKVEILQNNYTGDVSPIVGTGSPVEIEWDADDDIYNPIIGSRCKLNFFVTDTAVYDEFYRADEREYKVKIKYYQPAGNAIEAEAVTWDGADMIWDANLGAPLYFQEFWEGFLVVDRYEESILSTPYPIALEAIDGLGTLDGFDAPLNTTDTSNTENLFYYLKEILLLTGHEFDIYIANSIRKTDGAANDSIFHDIEINEYGLFNKNLTLKTAKDVLEQILKITNSRIFQSYGRWYVVNNSSLIDNRVDVAQTLADANADSGADVNDDPQPPTQENVYTSPVIDLDGQAEMYVGSSYFLKAHNSGTPAVSYVFTLPDSSTITQTSDTINTGTLFAEDDGDTYSVVATDANGNTGSDSFTLSVTADRPDIDDRDAEQDETTDTSYGFNIDVTNQVTDSYISPIRGSINYAAGEVGDAFTMEFNVVSLTGEFTSASQVTSSTITSKSGNYTVSKALNGDFIVITVTGNLPLNPQTETLTLIGAADVQQFTTSYTLSTNVTNASYAASPAALSRTGGVGKPYTMTITYTAQSGYEFTGLGNVQIQASDDIGQTITSSFTSSQLVVTITGEQSIADQSATITITGAAQYANPATSITISPRGAQDVSESGGYFDVSITSDGGYFVYTPNEWIHLSRTSGTPNETFLRVNFDRNLRRNTRTGYIYFRPRGSETNLATLTLTQESAIETQ